MSHVHVGWKCKRDEGEKESVSHHSWHTSLIFSAVSPSPAGQGRYYSPATDEPSSHLCLSWLRKLLSLSYRLQMIWPMKVWPQCGKLCWLSFLRLKDQCIKSNIYWSDWVIEMLKVTASFLMLRGPGMKSLIFQWSQQSPSSHCLDLLSEGPPGETCTWQDVCKALQPFNHTFTPFSALHAHFSLNSRYIPVKL